MGVVSLRNIIRAMEDIADPSWAFSWDNVGLQLGDKNIGIERILVALDPSQPVVSEAVALKSDLIISHHPLFFHPPTSLSFSEPEAGLVRQLIRNDIAVYSAHTNLDKALEGTCHLLFQKLGLGGEEILDGENPPAGSKKIVVFVPREQVEEVAKAIFDGGGGRIGNYSDCSFRVAGTGTYLPEAGTSPYKGEAGKMERVDEIRLETVVPQENVSPIVREICRVHPYEEVALDVYPLETTSPIGIGRVGNLPEPMILSDWASEVKKKLGIKALRLIGNISSQISRVAVVAGSGGEYIRKARHCGADCLVTGDIRYHQARQAEAAGIGILDIGHYHSERLIVDDLVDRLSTHPTFSESELEIRKAESEEDPFLFL